MIPHAPRLSDHPAWPTMAAAIATLLGMGSCVVTAIPLTLIGAPVVALGLSALLFHALLPRGRPAGTLEQHEKRIGRAAWVAWLVTIGVTWALSGWANTQLVRAGLSADSGARELGVLGGIVVGGILAAQVRAIGAAYWKRTHIPEPASEARDDA